MNVLLLLAAGAAQVTLPGVLPVNVDIAQLPKVEAAPVDSTFDPKTKQIKQVTKGVTIGRIKVYPNRRRLDETSAAAQDKTIVGFQARVLLP